MESEVGKVVYVNPTAVTPYGFIHPQSSGKDVYFRFANGHPFSVNEVDRRVDYNTAEHVEEPTCGAMVVFVRIQSKIPKKFEAVTWGYKTDFDGALAICAHLPFYTPARELRPQAILNAEALLRSPLSIGYMRYIVKRKISRDMLIEVCLAGIRFWDAVAVNNTYGARGVTKCLQEGKVPLQFVEDVLKKGFGLGLDDYRDILTGYGCRLSNEAMTALRNEVTEQTEFLRGQKA